MDLSYIRSLAQRAGNHWFDASAMQFFKSRILDSTWTKIDDNTYRFISSEKFDEESPRLYTVREVTLDPFDVETIGEFQAYKTSREALKNIRNNPQD